MPASKDTRVRVEFFAKIMARVRPLSGWYSVPARWRCFRILRAREQVVELGAAEVGQLKEVPDVCHFD